MDSLSGSFSILDLGSGAGADVTACILSILPYSFTQFFPSGCVTKIYFPVQAFRLHNSHLANESLGDQYNMQVPAMQTLEQVLTIFYKPIDSHLAL